MKSKGTKKGKAKGKAPAARSALATIFTAKGKPSKILRRAEGGMVAATPQFPIPGRPSSGGSGWGQPQTVAGNLPPMGNMSSSLIADARGGRIGNPEREIEQFRERERSINPELRREREQGMNQGFHHGWENGQRPMLPQGMQRPMLPQGQPGMWGGRPSPQGMQRQMLGQMPGQSQMLGQMPNNGGYPQRQTPVGQPPLMPPTGNWLPTIMSGGSVPLGQNTAPPMGSMGGTPQGMSTQRPVGMAAGGAVQKTPVTNATATDAQRAAHNKRAMDQWQQSFQGWLQSGVGQRQTSVFTGFPETWRKPKETTNATTTPPPTTGGELPPTAPPATVVPTPPSGGGGTGAGFGIPATGHFPIYTPPRYQPPIFASVPTAQAPAFARGGMVARRTPKKYI